MYFKPVFLHMQKYMSIITHARVLHMAVKFNISWIPQPWLNIKTQVQHFLVSNSLLLKWEYA